MNLKAVFDKFSGNDIVKTARRMAEEALNNNPVTDEHGKVSLDENGQGYMDPNKARNALSERHGKVMDGVTRSLNNHMPDSAVKHAQDQLKLMRTLEVAQVCVDVYSAPENANPREHSQRLANALAGFHPTNAKQAASSLSLERTLNGLKPQDSDSGPRSRVEIQASFTH